MLLVRVAPIAHIPTRGDEPIASLTAPVPNPRPGVSRSGPAAAQRSGPPAAQGLAAICVAEAQLAVPSGAARPNNTHSITHCFRRGTKVFAIQGLL
jgi:hypothetical protein